MDRKRRGREMEMINKMTFTVRTRLRKLKRNRRNYRKQRG
jgi:hypothetical protein